MTSLNPTGPCRASRWWLSLLLATTCAVRAIAVDTEPTAPEASQTPTIPESPAIEETTPTMEQPAAPVAPESPPEVTPPVEAPSAPSPAPEPAADVAPKRSVYRDQLIGVFQSVHLRAHESAGQVVGVFGDVLTEGRVDDQVVSVFGNAVVRERVSGQVVSVFGNCTITQDVRGDVVCVFGDLVIGPGVHVGGQVVSVGGSTDLHSTATIGGQEVAVPIPGLRHLGTWVRDSLLHGRLYPHYRASTWIFVGAMLALSLLVSAIFRSQVEASISVLERRPAAASVNAMLSALLVPAGFFLVTITGVGVFVVPFLWLAVMFATLVGVIAISRFCGERMGLGMNSALALTGGHLVFAALYALPFVGLLLWAGVMMLGFGTAITALLESRRREVRTNGSTSTPPPPASASMMPPASPPASEASPSSVGFTEETATPASPAPPIGGAALPEAAGVWKPTPMPPMLMPIERAGFWLRVAAGALDLVFVSVVYAFAPGFISFPLLLLAYFVAFWAWRATTPGGIILNLRIDRVDGRKVDAGVAVVRGLGAIISCVPLFLGFLWMNWDPERQTWHDKIAGTVVVRVPRGQPLF